MYDAQKLEIERLQQIIFADFRISFVAGLELAENDVQNHNYV